MCDGGRNCNRVFFWLGRFRGQAYVASSRHQSGERAGFDRGEQEAIGHCRQKQHPSRFLAILDTFSANPIQSPHSCCRDNGMPCMKHRFDAAFHLGFLKSIECTRIQPSVSRGHRLCSTCHLKVWTRKYIGFPTAPDRRLVASLKLSIWRLCDDALIHEMEKETGKK